jgi:WD40 repeat protein
MIIVQKKHILQGHKDSVYALVSAENGNTIFSAAADGYVVRWDLDKQEPEKEIMGRVIANIANSSYALCLLAQKNLLAFGHNTDGIHVLDLAKNNEIFSAGFTKAAIFDIQEFDNQLFVACGDGNVVVIDSIKYNLKTTFQFSDKAARCLAVAPQKKELAVGYSDYKIRIFDLQTLELKQEFLAHQNSVFSLCYSPTEEYLLSGGRDAHLKIWKIENQASLLAQDIVAHLYTINHIAYNPNGKTFATCSKDKSIKLWQSADFQLLKVIDKGRHAAHSTSINKLCWLSETALVSCSDDTTIVIWEVAMT